MKRIRRESVERVLDRVDIVDILSPYVNLKKGGNSYKGCCPFHQEKSPSFHVTPAKGVYHCFGCGASGNALTFLDEKMGLGFVDAIEHLAERYGVTLEYEQDANEGVDPRQPLWELNQTILMSFRSTLEHAPHAQEYLEQRSIPRPLIDQFAIGYADGTRETLLKAFAARHDDLARLGLIAQKDEDQSWYDRFRQRLMFPICDGQGNIAGFGGRDLSGRSPAKYMNSPESILFKKKELLYGYHIARPSIRSRRRAILVEGYFDVIRAHQYGFTETVAVMGTALGEEHLHLLGAKTDLYLVFDGDDAGTKAALRTVSLLGKCLNPLRAVFLPAGDDPDTFLLRQGESDFNELIGKARDLGEFYIDYQLETARGDINSTTTVLRELKVLLESIQDTIKRQAYYNYLTRRSGIDVYATAIRPSTPPQAPRNESPYRTAHSTNSYEKKRPYYSQTPSTHGGMQNVLQGKITVDKNYLEKYLLSVMFSSDTAFENLVDKIGTDILHEPYNSLLHQATDLHNDGLTVNAIVQQLSDGSFAGLLRHVHQVDTGMDGSDRVLEDVIAKVFRLYQERQIEELEGQIRVLASDPSPEAQKKLSAVLQEHLQLKKEIDPGGKI
ncbi:DNA primase [Chrysiogenes arsenatis]|uniref:DNA primase n=1 Tax=Chrysiogenes arsenatis TaxID=309797 RepID=UPI000404FE6F|nr:DNA primase [Chrysiogenes arsenatis]